MSKLPKNTLPSAHSFTDFSGKGPVATKDGDFDNCYIADLGCFGDNGEDKNKFYLAAIVQSTKSDSWYVYYEWGRTGHTNHSYQFIECSSESEAKAEFSKQLHAKNDKRGVWVDHKTLGRILQAKPGKDCYLVRELAGRGAHIPALRAICNGAAIPAAVHTDSKIDGPSLSLLNDLGAQNVSYTQSSLIGGVIPSAAAIKEARTILEAATTAINKGNTSELSELTRIIYSRIPKKKGRNEDCTLSPNNIQAWEDDLDAFETALKSSNTKVKVDFNIDISWIDPSSDLGKYLHSWVMSASQNKHANVRGIKIVNLWQLNKEDQFNKLNTKIKNTIKNDKEFPLHQSLRTDLDSSLRSAYDKSGTFLLFHGTRSVNVKPILETSLRLPHQLKGVSINGAAFGPGLYAADDFRKSVGYTSSDNSYWTKGDGRIRKRKSFMFLMDTCLGNCYIPPYSGNYSSKIDHKTYHSVYAKSGKSGVQNNEFIVFDAAQHYLRYLMEFEVTN